MSNSEHPQVNTAEIAVEQDDLLDSDPAQTDVAQTDVPASAKSDRRRALDDLVTKGMEQARRRGESGRTTITTAYRNNPRRSQAGIGALVLLVIAAIVAAIIRSRR